MVAHIARPRTTVVPEAKASPIAGLALVDGSAGGLDAKRPRRAKGDLRDHVLGDGAIRVDPGLLRHVEDSGQTVDALAGVLADVGIKADGHPLTYV
jgi:hypothetical protein